MLPQGTHEELWIADCERPRWMGTSVLVLEVVSRSPFPPSFFLCGSLLWFLTAHFHWCFSVHVELMTARGEMGINRSNGTGVWRDRCVMKEWYWRRGSENHVWSRFQESCMEKRHSSRVLWETLSGFHKECSQLVDVVFVV